MASATSKPVRAYSAPPAGTLILATAVSFAVLTGLAEVALLAVAHDLLHRFINFFGDHLIWFGPIADLAIFSIPALLLWLASRRFPRVGSLPVVVGVFAFLSSLDLFLLVTELAGIAVVILAAGVAVQTARVVSAHPDAYYRLLRLTLGWLNFPRTTHKQEPPAVEREPGAGPSEPQVPLNPEPAINRRQFLLTAGAAVAGLAIGVQGWDKLAEARTLAVLPRSVVKRPNVLLVILDTVRAQNLSLYGYPRATSPQLERLARNGVLFERAVSTASWTLPSHASMFTGRYLHELSVDYASALDRTWPTLAEFLSGQGYQTAGFVSNTWYCSRESGLARGFQHYEDWTFTPERALVGSSVARALADSEELRAAIGFYEELGRKSAPEVSGDLLRWLSQRDESRPFFAFVNFLDAHEPYLPPAPFNTLFGSGGRRANPRHDPGWTWTPADVQAELDAYDGAIAYLDAQLGKLFDELAKRGTLDHTLVIVVSDHGEEFDEHGIMDHGFSLYLPVLHTLMLMSMPGRVPANLRVPYSVSPRDLPATILDLIGIDGQSYFPGRSLARYWGQNAGTEPVLSEVRFLPGYPRWYPVSDGDVRSLLLEPYHYIQSGKDREELFDTHVDPWEQSDLAKTEQGQRLISRFRDSLEGLSARRG